MFDINSYKFYPNNRPAQYNEWVSVVNNSIVHTRAIFPKKLIESKWTKLPKEIIDYIKDNYECLTADPINKSIESIIKHISNSNYGIDKSIELPQITFDSQKYNFIDFHIHVLLPLMLEDPNGLLYWSVKKGIVEQEPNKQAEPLAIYVSSDKIVDIGEDYFVYLYGSIVVENNGSKSILNTYKIITKEAEYDLIPYYSNGLVEYRKEIFYIYNYTNNCYSKLGGRQTRNEKGQSYLLSYFAGIFSWANDFIRIYQHFKPIHTRMSTPIIQIKPSLCNAKGCEDGIVKSNCIDGACEEKQCTSCGGTGKVLDYTPYSTIIKPDTRLGATADNEDVIKYITPPIEAVRASEETSFRYLDILKEACNILPTGTDASGVSKELDRQQKYDAIEVISHQIFSLVKFSMECVRDIYTPNVNNRKEIVIILPNKIDLRNEDSYLDGMKDITLPYQVRVINAIKYFDKLYAENEKERELNKYVILKDAVSLSPTLEIIQLKAAGLLSDEQIKIHKYIKGVVLLLELNKYDFNTIDKAFMSELDKIQETIEIPFNAI